MNEVGTLDRTHRARPGRALATARLYAFRNRVLGGSRRRRFVKVVALALGGLWFAGSIAAASFAATDSAASPTDAAHMLAAFFALVAIGGFIGASSSSLQALYLASDLPFLRSLPLPLRVTFALKFADSMVGQLLPAIILVAALAGYAAARTERWLALVGVPIIGVLLLFGATALAMLHVALLGRLVDPRRAGRLLALISLALVVLTWVGYLAIAPDISTPEAGDSPPMAAVGPPLAAAGASVAWTPAGWAAQAVVAISEENLVDFVSYGSLLALVAIMLIGASLMVFRGAVAGTRISDHARPSASAQPDRPLGRWVATGLTILPGPAAALVFKEWLTMFRDVRRLSGAVWPLGMVAVYTVLLSRDEVAAPAGAPGLAFWLSCGALALVPWGASLGISIYAFGTEGRQIHLLRSLPLPPRTLFRAKALANLVPVLALGETAAIVVSSLQEASRGQFFGLLGLVAWASTGYVLIDTAAAAIAPNFAAEQIQRTTAIAGRIVGFAAGLAFTIASSVAAIRLIFFATGVPRELRPLLDWELFWLQPLGWPLVVASAAVAVFTVAWFADLAERDIAALLRDDEALT